MIKFFANKKGSSVMEYMALIVFLMAAFVVFQKYIFRGFSGRWKSVGDTFSFGRQYDPKPYGDKGDEGGTLECEYDPVADVWRRVSDKQAIADCQAPDD